MNCYVDNDSTLNHDTKSENTFQICTTLQQVAKAIIQHSFAIYQVDTSTHESLVHAWKSAHTFLSSAQDLIGNCTQTSCSNANSSEALEDHISKYRQVIKGNLMGFNQPSSSKLLFRAFCSKYACDCGQSWPNEEMKCDSMKVASLLHSLLVQCLYEIQRELSRQRTSNMLEKASIQISKGSELEGIRQIEKLNANTKRQRLNGASQYSKINSSKKLKMHTEQEREPLKTKTIREFCIHEKMADSELSCPLDYFFYHNKNATPSNVNCSEHIDRGLLICINLTDVIGLEVLPSGSNEFIRPEEVAKTIHVTKPIQKDAGNQCTEFVCILSGEQLRHALLVPRPNDYEIPSLSPTVHRVTSHLSEARLSISYELRGKF